jgi:hypothetical protein
MTVKITWDIDTLHRVTSTGLVYEIDFVVNGEDDPYKTNLRGKVYLPKPDTLVPYSDITKTLALKWVQDRLNELNAEDATRNPSSKQLEDAVTKKIEEDIKPTVATGKPWS